MEIIPIVKNINMATIIVTGLFNENSDKFILFASDQGPHGMGDPFRPFGPSRRLL
jgi:hypothetical protein